MTRQVPVPLVIVKVAPEFEHAPPLLYTTGNPELLAAATAKFCLYVAVAGACMVRLIVWPSGSERARLWYWLAAIAVTPKAAVAGTTHASADPPPRQPHATTPPSLRARLEERLAADANHAATFGRGPGGWEASLLGCLRGCPKR